MIVLVIFIVMVVIPAVTIAAMVKRGRNYQRFTYLTQAEYDAKMEELEQQQLLAIEAATTESAIDQVDATFKIQRGSYKVRR